MWMTGRGIAVAALTMLGALALRAQAPSLCTTPREACAFFEQFLTALNRRDWAAFRATLAPDVSVIFDEPGPPMRQDGHEAVEAVFRLIFPADTDAPAPALVPLRPLQLRAQDFGDVVVVSFHLADGARTGRRTLVLRRTSAGWHVAHIHGSSSSVGER